MLRILCLTIIVFVIGCSAIKPNFVKEVNKYQYQDLSLNSYESIRLIYNYNVESLQNSYDKLFCTDLSNCQDNITNIKNNPLFDGFDLTKKPILNNTLGIKEVNLYRIIYHTKGQNGIDETVSGGIYYPNTNKIKGVILFFHPTFFAKSSVSTYDVNNSVNKAVAAVFAANGYIVLYPDYIGMGINRNKVHPYVLYPQVNALDGLSIIQASQKFISDKINIETKIPLYVTGYSEGSAYALWFSRLYQEKQDFFTKFNTTNYNLKKVIPISGAYNLSEVTWKYLFSNNNTFNSEVYKTSNSFITSLLKPPLVSIALLSYGYYGESANYDRVFNLDFFNMHCSLEFISNCNINGSNLNLLQLLLLESSVVKDLPNNDNAFEIYLVGKINNAANYTIANDSIYTIFSNNIKPLVNMDLINNNNNLLSLLKNGDVYYWHSEIPTILLTLKRDSVVSPLNSDYAYFGMLANNSQNLQLIILDNNQINNKLLKFIPSMEVDHTNGFTYLFLIALNKFDK